VTGSVAVTSTTGDAPLDVPAIIARNEHYADYWKEQAEWHREREAWCNARRAEAVERARWWREQERQS